MADESMEARLKVELAKNTIKHNEKVIAQHRAEIAKLVAAIARLEAENAEAAQDLK